MNCKKRTLPAAAGLLLSLALSSGGCGSGGSNPAGVHAGSSQLATGTALTPSAALVKTMALAGLGTGISLDRTHNRVYFATAGSSGQNNIEVIDGPSATLAGITPVFSNPVSVAVDPGLNHVFAVDRGFSANYTYPTSSNLTVIAAGSNLALVSTLVGQTLAEAIDNPTSSEVYVANPPGGSPDTSNSLLILNPATGLPVKSITVGYSAMDSYNNFGARRFAVDRTRNVTYVSNGADNTISVVAGGTDTVTTPIQGLSGPIAVDETSGRIYVLNVSAGQVFAVDGASYQRVSSYSLTKSAVDTSEAPADVAVDASVQKLYVVTLDGFTPAGNTLTTIDLPTGTARTVEIPGIPADPYSYPNAVVANPDDHRVYVSNGYDLSISIYDGTKL